MPPRGNVPKKPRKAPTRAVNRRKKKLKEPRFKLNLQVSWKPVYTRWLLYLLTFLLIISVFLGINKWLQNPKNMPITRIEVKGDLKYVTREALQKALQPYIKTNLYMLDAEGLEKELESHPWVRSVALYRKWPQTLIIAIEEQRPLAFWGEDKMVNRHGEIFNAILEGQKGIMPVLFNTEGEAITTIDNYKKAQQWLKDLPVGVERFLEDARGAWKLTLTNGITVDVGRSEQKKRLRRLVVGYLKELAKKEKRVANIDLRYTNGFAVAWKRR